MHKHINTEKIPNQFTGRTNEQKNIGTMASIPAGFQKGTDSRHNPIVNKNGKETRKKSIKFFFIYIRLFVYQISEP